MGTWKGRTRRPLAFEMNLSIERKIYCSSSRYDMIILEHSKGPIFEEYLQCYQFSTVSAEIKFMYSQKTTFTNSYFNPARQIRNRNSRWSYSTANINCKSLCLPMYTCGQHSLPQRLLLRPSSDHPSHHDQSTGFTSAIALRTYVVSLTKLRRTCSGFSK